MILKIVNFFYLAKSSQFKNYLSRGPLSVKFCARADNLVCRALRSTGIPEQDEKKYRFLSRSFHLTYINRRKKVRDKFLLTVYTFRFWRDKMSALEKMHRELSGGDFMYFNL